ncbi:hypothetical protein HGB07_09020 [Candidatus Roizmanbacteria bacterium]|nr:hypothetical protein [Candidatus Roizmanbacteria bacterium]
MITSEMKIVIELLKNCSKEFNGLKKEARIALYSKNDSHEYLSKLQARGQLLIDLPGVIAIPLSTLKGADREIADEIEMKIACFAGDAKDALDENNIFFLASLLTYQGSVAGDKNDLEKLIEYLEDK